MLKQSLKSQNWYQQMVYATRNPQYWRYFIGTIKHIKKILPSIFRTHIVLATSDQVAPMFRLQSIQPHDIICQYRLIIKSLHKITIVTFISQNEQSSLI